MKGQSSVLPSKVSVRFLSRRCSGLPSTTIPAWYVKEIDIASAAIDGIEGSPDTKQFHDRALALFAGGGTTPTNQTALDTLASQTAIDYYNWNKDSFDESYPQIISPILDALTDTIEWEYRPGQCVTRRYTAPYNGEAEEMMHHDPANSACADSLPATVVQKTPCFESYGPIASGANALAMQVFENCWQGGILTQKYKRTETLGCGCLRSCGSLPFCQLDFPTNAYIGDSLGTHTMVKGVSATSSVGWISGAEDYPASVYKHVPNDFFTDCVLDGSIGKVIYRFTLQCGSGSDPNKFQGILSKTFIIRCCGPQNTGPYSAEYGSGTPTSLPTPELTAVGTQLYTCESTVFDFNYPTDLTIQLTGCAGFTIPIPGGGGLLTVTF